MSDKKQIPCLEGWITMPPESPRIIGSRCKSCGHYFFPKGKFCRNPYCENTESTEDVKLSNKGTLFSYTINYYRPPQPYHSPDPFIPFGLAVVELPEGIRIQGQIPKGIDFSKLKIGIEMEVVRDTLYVDKDGTEVLTWMFKPIV